MKITIHGSCVTRDAFEMDHPFVKDVILLKYFARSSIISADSPPIIIEESDIQNISLFQKRCVHSDLVKAFYLYLEDNDLKNSYIIIDFIDERFKLINNKQTWITLSDEYQNSNLFSINDGKIYDRDSLWILDLWKNCCSGFINRLKKLFEPTQVILHKAFWMEEYLEDNTVKKFNQLNLIKKNNEVLNEYYSFFESNFSGVRVIDLTHMNYKADKNHKWGFSPVHYVNEYYMTLLDHLEIISR